MPPVFFDQDLKMPVRAGSLADQARSTYEMIDAALTEGRHSDAAALARYLIQECEEAKTLFLSWAADICKILDDEAGPRGNAVDGEAAWGVFCDGCQAAAHACAPGRERDARAMLKQTRLAWLSVHDQLCDNVLDLVDRYAARYGEESVGALWQRLMEPMIQGYSRYDVAHTPWSTSSRALLLITAEALRGHLSGSKRLGEIAFIEERDRVGFRFAPCGSGGRDMSGQATRRYGVTTAEHDWAWNTTGVCLYCAHCCVLSELNPIRTLGYPAREVEPPFENESGRRTDCTWWVYRDPKLVPNHVYRRTGHVKPRTKGDGDEPRPGASLSGLTTPDGS